MFHLVAKTMPGRLVFRTWEEGCRLFDALRRAFPELVGLVLMPDHLHLMLPHADRGGRLPKVLSGYTRWLTAKSAGRVGTHLWQPIPPAEPLADAQKIRRSIRYLQLNPCRKGLAPDPLSWPLSTHRDLLGFSTSPMTLVGESAAAFHRYVSSDPSVCTEGSPIPAICGDKVDYISIRDGVSAVLRWPLSMQNGPLEAKMLVRAAVAHGVIGASSHGSASFGALIGRSESQVSRLRSGDWSKWAPSGDAVLDAVIKVVGDSRFGALLDGDLRRLPEWRDYRSR